MRDLLGGKGANLCEMTQIGLNVPPGFVVTTETCLTYLAEPDRTLPLGVIDQVRQNMLALEKATGKKFGEPENPLLVSVRSGSAMSMPGMMDTILNLGLNSKTLRGLVKQTNNERFGYDAYRRFIQLFGKVALGVPDEKFDVHFEEVKRNVSTEAFGEFLMLIETGALTLDEDIVVPFELGLRYEKMGFKPADSFIAAYAEWVMADALVSENRHFLFDHPHLPFKTLSAESALKYIKSSSLK